MFPVYGDCMCSSCATNRRHPSFNQDISDECPRAQSGNTVHQGKEGPGAVDKEQNVTFANETDANLLFLDDNRYDHTFQDGYQQGAELGDFFSRPVRIFQYEWAVGNVTPAFFGFNPWELYFSQISVKQKAARFKLFHGTLHLKFLINGAPFHYGRFFVGVRPTAFDNNTLTLTPSTGATCVNMYDASSVAKTWQPLRCLYSQRKHVFLDPSTNQPADIEWPFIAATNYIDLQELDTFNRMGRIEMWEMNILRHANGETDPVRISVFAHFTNVSITGLTYNNVIVPDAQSSAAKKKKSGKPGPKAMSKARAQYSGGANDPKMSESDTEDLALEMSGKEREVTQADIDKEEAYKKKQAASRSAKSGKDEYGKGIVSAPATAVAKAASYFTNIPIIGPFARATEIGASAVSSIAKIFGFSRPADIADFCQTRNVPLGRMAVTSGSDPLVKLSLDPKQELCIDPATVGIASDDELSFLHIAKQETLIDQFPWTISGTGSTGTIYMIPVNPWVQPVFVTQSQTVYAQTSLSFVSRPFSYWTGSLRYRFQIVASQFHRGRILIQYEPDISASFNTQEPIIALDGDGINARYSHILDLSQERDVTFEVNWAQHEGWRYVLSNGTASIQVVSAEGPFNFGTVFVADPAVLQTYNGILRVFVINSLTAPDNSSDVQINVFVSAGDSFQVAAPGEGITGLAYARDGVTVGPPELPEAQGGRFFKRFEKKGISDTWICLFLLLLQIVVNRVQPILHLDLRERFNYASIADWLDANNPIPVAHAGMGTFTTDSENAPNMPTDYVMNGNYRVEDVDANSIYMGEVVASVRTMLRRYNYHRSISHNLGGLQDNETGIWEVHFQQRDLPNGPGVYPGNEGSAITTASIGSPTPVPTPYNINVLTYLRYYCQAYVGYRGGVRWKVVCYRSERLQHWPLQVQRRRVGFATELTDTVRIALNSLQDTIRWPTYAQRMIANSLTGTRSTAGIHVSATGVNPTLEYELPFYSHYRYGELHEPQTVPSNVTLPFRYRTIMQHGHSVATFWSPIYQGAEVTNGETYQQNIQFDNYVAAAEDFTFFIFIGAPPILVSDATSITPGSAP